MCLGKVRAVRLVQIISHTSMKEWQGMSGCFSSRNEKPLLLAAQKGQKTYARRLNLKVRRFGRLALALKRGGLFRIR